MTWLSSTSWVGLPGPPDGTGRLRLHSCTDEILRLTAGEDPSRTFSWLGGSRLPLAGIMAHLTNELLVHGRDIARRVNAPWQIPER